MISPAEETAPHTAEAVMKIATPTISTCLRPKMSPRRPPGMKNEARASM